MSVITEHSKKSDLVIGEEKLVSTVFIKLKGLEFENVVVAECVDDVYPNFASKTKEEISEDARALYVAISRSKKRLYIIYHNKSLYGKP
ncbi:MAG: ATP-binding domain-containing protein [Ignavibacteria bacterium]|nr:ATP-binding domain-containing protein [Ignavibacteria bacterium]